MGVCCCSLGFRISDLSNPHVGPTEILYLFIKAPAKKLGLSLKPSSQAKVEELHPQKTRHLSDRSLNYAFLKVQGFGLGCGSGVLGLQDKF